MGTAQVLVIDDERVIRLSIEQTLRAAGYDVAGAETAAGGLTLFEQLLPHVVFLDVRLPDEDGLELLKKLKQSAGDETAVIVMTAYGEIRSAVEAMRLGAFDYLKKPFDFDELEALVAKCLQTSNLKREVGELREEWKKTYDVTGIVAHSESMKAVLSVMERIAESEATTVLVQGENGTGKDLVARAIHYRSKRAERLFLDFSCTAMPDTLFESELFGYEKGAFTDAKATKRGLLEVADGGTLFLDEVGEMPLVSQAKFLKVLEAKRFRRLGSTEDREVDIRIVAATNRNLEVAVKDGKFREDLYYRLNVVPIKIPPLRERPGDIVPLLDFYMRKYNVEFRKDFTGISDEARRAFESYAWPGNVRELKNMIERIMILERGQTILPEHIPPEITATSAKPPQFRLPRTGIRLEDVEKDFVQQAVEMTGGNQTRAAQLLGVSRDALRYRMQKFGLMDS
jgi:two-component system response regulator AtoC